MSAFAALTGFFVWIVVLSLPLAIYFLVILSKRGREVNRAHWADLRPVQDEKIKDETQTKEDSKKAG